jgi:predicted dinucleotide-utilizing enzyme
MEKINIALVGYGNVGRGVEEALKLNAETELVAVLTRRPEQVRKAMLDIPSGYLSPHSAETLRKSFM